MGKEEVKLSLFEDDIILYLENSKGTTKKLLELINESGKVAGYKINIWKYIYIHQQWTIKKKFRSSCCGSGVMKLTSIHENMSSIPGLRIQCCELQHRLAAAAPVGSLAWELHILWVWPQKAKKERTLSIYIYKNRHI